MAGTVAGARKAARTNIERHGKDFYRNIGRIGGKRGHTGGFAVDVECDCDAYQGSHYKRN